MTQLELHMRQLQNTWTAVHQTLEQELLPQIQATFEANLQELNSPQFDNLKKRWGIYIFYYRESEHHSYDSFVPLWNAEGFKNYPKVCKGRFKKSDVLPNGYHTFYLGKTEDLGKRLKEHIEDVRNKSTYGLKLRERSNFDNSNISYSYWQLPETLEHLDNPLKQLLLTQLEHRLRTATNPWIGKQ